MSLSHWRAGLVAFLCASLICEPAGAALVFTPGVSTIVYKHDVVEGGVVNRTVSQPSPAIATPSSVTFVLPDATITGAVLDALPSSFKSRAKVGMAHNETPTTGTGFIKSGSLLTQSDSSNVSSAFSTLDIDFKLVWTASAPGFGAPIIGSFSVPLLAVVGTGGAAKAELIDMHWERFDGFTTTDLRAPASNTLLFTSGSTLTTLTIPGAAFSPSSLTTGNQFIVRGRIKLSVENSIDPTTIILNPEYQDLVADDQAQVIYRFDDGPVGSSPAVAVNSGTLGAALNGSYTPGTQLAQGLRNAALALNNLGEGVQGMIQSTPSFTAEVWAASDTPVWNTDGWLANASGQNGFVLNPIAGTTQWQGIVFDAGGAPQVIGTFDAGPADITHLHHYAITYDDASGLARMFFDGTLVSANNLGPIIRLPGSAIAALLGFNAQGRLDEFAYYDYALRAEMLESHFLLGMSDPESTPQIIGAQIPSVPEPGTMLLLFGALMLTGANRRRRSSIRLT